MPYFSVVIPTYNRAHSIRKAIDSVLNQSFQDFEIIVVDDASPDETEQVVKAISDPRLRYFKNETNQERCVSRNRGIDLAKGKYICFLDSDDYHLPDHLEKLHVFIQAKKDKVAFFFTNAWNESEDGVRSERNCPKLLTSRASVNTRVSTNNHSLTEALEVNLYTYFLRYTVNPQRWCVHRSIFEKVKFDPEVVICEDMDTSLRIVNAGFPVYQLNERTTVYVAAADSFTHGDTQKWEKELFYLKRIFAKKELKGKLPLFERNRLLSMCYFHLSNKQFSLKNRWNTIRYAIMSFLLCPKGYNGKTNKIVIYQIVMSIISCFRKEKEFLNYRLPKSLELKNYNLIKSRRLDYIIPSRLKVLKNVFISHEGLVLNKMFLSKRCAFNLKGNKDNTFGFIFWKLTLEQYLVSKFGKSLKAVKIKEPVLLIHTKWFNYSFWVTDSLLRLVIAEENGILDKVKLIYPEEWGNIDFVNSSLEAFDLEKLKIPKGEHIISKKLYLPETRDWTSSFSPDQISRVRKKIVNYSNKLNLSLNYSDRVYLTRKSRGVRSIENEEEVIKLLKEYDFSIIDFGELTFWEQVEVMKKANCFISIHGAGFANILYMKDGASVIELINESYAEKEYKFPFYHLANSLNLNYMAQFGCVENKETALFNYKDNYNVADKDRLVNQNIIIDLHLLQTNLELIISTKKSELI